jgi:ankyrin repeat protein
MTGEAETGAGGGVEARPEAPPVEEVFPDARVRAVAAAAARGDAAQVRSIITKSAGDPEGPVDINATSAAGVNPLMYAIVTRDEKAARALLDAGADPNHRTPLGDSPMLAAGLTEDQRFLKLLLERGGDPNLKNNRGEPLLHQVLDYFLWDNAHFLLDKGADINGADPAGETPAFRLALMNQFEQVHRFLERGADPDRATVTGSTVRDLVNRAHVAPGSPADEWRGRVLERLR